jgi:prepilin-type N-terminal cleavage/methylation domain-containing protein
MRRATAALRDERGFTLIELLIVIIVLGSLAAIVVIAVGSTRKTAAESACQTGVKSVELSAEAYNTRALRRPAVAPARSRNWRPPPTPKRSTLSSWRPWPP